MPQAYAFTAFGGPEVETFLDVPVPDPGPGQLLIRVRAAGVNPVDWKKRTGYRPAGAPETALPAGFGGEASGVVERLGAGVTGFAVGDEVFGQALTGGYAERTLLDAGFSAIRPPSVSFEDAATLPIAAATAHDAVVQLDLPPGSTLLITGVGGGVGVAAAQIAGRFGLTVIGTAGAAKHDFVASLGVTPVEYGDGVEERIRAVAPQGVDGIVDLVGGAALEAVAGLVADKSKLITACDRQTVARLGGLPVQRERSRRVLEAVAGWVADGTLDPYVVEVFTLPEARQALRHVEDGHARGKVVITIPA